MQPSHRFIEFETTKGREYRGKVNGDSLLRMWFKSADLPEIGKVFGETLELVEESDGFYGQVKVKDVKSILFRG